MKQDNSLGELIYELHDDEGVITVYQKNNLRYLTFGNKVEQSCLTINKPYRLEHVYTQAMMLGLLLKDDIRSALVLGLGGGSLVRALHHVFPRMKIQAVEYRQSVIDLAIRYFELDQTYPLKLYCDEADHFLKNSDQYFDLIFADLYLADDVHETQLTRVFYELCKERLNEGGLLLINQWGGDFHRVKLSHSALDKVFEDNVLYLSVKGGNNIVFAFNGELPDLNRKKFFEAAQQLGVKLDIPLQKLSRNFWQQNAQALQIKRYKIT